MICFVVIRCLSEQPSMEYAARVHGVPINPKRVDSPSTSDRRLVNISRMKGSDVSGSSKLLSAFMSSRFRTGLEITGPLPLRCGQQKKTLLKPRIRIQARVIDRLRFRTFTTSNSTPIAGSGVRMSLNMITPSGLKARQGCSDSSIAISAVSERCRKSNLSEYFRKSAMYLPA